LVSGSDFESEFCGGFTGGLGGIGGGGDIVIRNFGNYFVTFFVLCFLCYIFCCANVNE
jgi:hypothetical protein